MFYFSTFAYKFPKCTLITGQEEPGPCPVEKVLEHCLIWLDTQLTPKLGSKVTLEQGGSLMTSQSC